MVSHQDVEQGIQLKDCVPFGVVALANQRCALNEMGQPLVHLRLTQQFYALAAEYLASCVKRLRHQSQPLQPAYDATIRAVALTPLPDPSGEGWTDEEFLVVWMRFEQLDSSWVWKTDEQPAYATVEARPGADLAPAEPGLENSARIQKILGGRFAPERMEVGDAYEQVQVFPAPPEGTKELVVRTVTRLPSDEVRLLVPTLVKIEDLARPRF